MNVIKAKIIVLGRSGVGKTSIVVRSIRDSSFEHKETTVGVDYFSKKICYKEATVKLDIWDTAGMEEYKAVYSRYYRGVAAALLIFDITSKKSFNELEYWLKELKINNNKSFFLYIIGNKVDLDDKRQVFPDEIKEEIQRFKLLADGVVRYYECSALSSQGVKTIFNDLVQDIYTFSSIEEQIDDYEIVDLNSEEIIREQYNCCNNNYFNIHFSI